MRPVSSGSRLATHQKSVGDRIYTDEPYPEVEMQLVETNERRVNLLGLPSQLPGRFGLMTSISFRTEAGRDSLVCFPST